RFGIVHVGTELGRSQDIVATSAALGSFFPAPRGAVSVPTATHTPGIESVRFRLILGTTSLEVWSKDALGSFFPGPHGRPRGATVPRWGRRRGSAVAVTPVERLQVAHVGRIGGAEGVGVDGPAGGVLGVAVAVLLDQAVEELEELP